MKVVFDAYWWVSGPPSLRHVLREIVAAWSIAFPDDELTLVVRRDDHAAASVDAPAGCALVTTSLWPQALAATIAVPAAATAVDADLVLTHNFAAHAPGSLSAVYLHDVLFATNPEWFTAVERAYFSLMLRWIRRADLVLTSSSSEASRIRATTRARTVLPVGLGLSSELTADGAALEADAELTPGRFVLTVGRLNARKNLALTIEAALASGCITADRPLVVVGSADGRPAVLGRAVDDAIAARIVRFTGFVSESRLRWYYRNASLFVFLSLGEGFGMPPVEAAYFSAPTLVSDLPVFHETLGRHASFVDPTDAAAVARAIAAGVQAGEARRVPARPRASIARRHDWSDTVHAIRSSVVERREAAMVSSLRP